MLNFTKPTIQTRHNFKFKTGFTLLELLIVIAVIGGLATIFITTYPASTKKARDTERISDIKQYQVALEAYANNHSGGYFAATGVLPTLCGTYLGSYTATCPNAPAGTANYQYWGTWGNYTIWAELEIQDRDGNTQYFIVCDSGLSGKSTTAPSANCPLP